MIIDSHQHFWRLGENDCTWPTPDLAAIHRDFGPADFEAVAAASGVGGAVLVQSQESDRDTDWLLDMAAASARVLGVVGWVDLKAANAPERIAALAARPKLRGLRPMLQGKEPDWILDPAAAPAIAAMEAHGLAFDALVYTRHLAALRTFARRHPGLRIVIDHGAKPPLESGALDLWRAEIAAAAALPNISCKLSGLLTEAAPGAGAAELAPCVAHLIDAFGPRRLMWGSDWPVLLLNGRYHDWLVLARALSGLSGRDLDAVFGGNAQAFYRL